MVVLTVMFEESCGVEVWGWLQGEFGKEKGFTLLFPCKEIFCYHFLPSLPPLFAGDADSPAATQCGLGCGAPTTDCSPQEIAHT